MYPRKFTELKTTTSWENIWRSFHTELPRSYSCLGFSLCQLLEAEYRVRWIILLTWYHHSYVSLFTPIFKSEHYGPNPCRWWDTLHERVVDKDVARLWMAVMSIHVTALFLSWEPQPFISPRKVCSWMNENLGLPCAISDSFLLIMWLLRSKFLNCNRWYLPMNSFTLGQVQVCFTCIIVFFIACTLNLIGLLV